MSVHRLNPGADGTASRAQGVELGREEGGVMKLEALIFDVDGTVVDTEELHRQAYNQTFLDFGFDWEWDAERYAELLGVSGGQDRLARYVDLIDLSPAEKTRLRRIIPAIHKEKTQLYGELIESNAVRPRPGVRRLIDEAGRANLRIGMVASSAAVNVDTLVTAALGKELRKSIGPIVCAEMVSRKKPAPDVYELCLSMLRVAAAAVVAFEDSSNGLAAAKAVGLYTVVTPSRWTAGQNFECADLVLPSLGDPGEPLPPSGAVRIGAPYLELAKLEALRSPSGPAFKVSEAGR
jgi:HAD superfamily hydrolase (TIGR01509 family)